MELTLKRLLEQAKFTTTRKGYDQEEVDDFLDRAVAMATKVEARLTKALADAERPTDTPVDAATAAPAVPTRSDEEVQAEIAAEVERRLEARVAEIEANRPAPPAPDPQVAGEEAARTLVLAQRTADAAVAEARQEAEAIRAEARREADQVAAAAAAEAEQARAEARGRLADEIRTLEDARNGLRTDVTVLEGHVEEQRVQLRSTVAELQRLLEDPGAFRLAPAPQTPNVVVPDLSDTGDPDDGPESGDAAGTSDPDPEPGGGGGGDDMIDLTSPGQGTDPTGSPDTPGGNGPSGPTGGAEPTDRGPVDHAAPGPDDLLDPGPPTAPVSAVELDLGGPNGADHASGSSPLPIPADDTDTDDAFLAELRKAMADEEPLGPREAPLGNPGPGFLDEERRGWRFGKRK